MQLNNVGRAVQFPRGLQDSNKGLQSSQTNSCQTPVKGCQAHREHAGITVTASFIILLAQLVGGLILVLILLAKGTEAGGPTKFERYA